MSKKKSYIIISIVVIVGLVIDLVTKCIFAEYLGDGKDIVLIPNFFKFTYVENTGAAYGMFGESTVALTIVSVLFVVAFCIYDYFNHSNNIFYVLGLSMIVSGALGNMIDRIFLGYVRDFISIRLFSFVFNLADAFITFGVIFFMVYLIISIIKEQKEKKQNELGDK